MRLRRTLIFAVPLLLLFSVAPSYAICGFCDINNNCIFQTGLGTSCKGTINGCQEMSNTNCNPPANAVSPSFASDYKIVSVDVVTPAKHTLTTNQVRVADTTPRSNVRTR
jgi:hypothetical protein